MYNKMCDYKIFIYLDQSHGRNIKVKDMLVQTLNDDGMFS